MSQTVDYQIRRSQRVKTMRIVVKPDRIEVVAPPLMPVSKIAAFVSAQQDWIKRASERVKIKAAYQASSFAPAQYQHGAAIPFQDQKLQLHLATHQGKRIRIQQADADSLLIELPDQLPAATDQSATIRLALSAWMKQQARQQAELLIAHHAPRFGLYPRSLRIKTQKSRWGSCGRLSRCLAAASASSSSRTGWNATARTRSS